MVLAKEGCGAHLQEMVIVAMFEYLTTLAAILTHRPTRDTTQRCRTRSGCTPRQYRLKGFRERETEMYIHI